MHSDSYIEASLQGTPLLQIALGIQSPVVEGIFDINVGVHPSENNVELKCDIGDHDESDENRHERAYIRFITPLSLVG